MTMNDRRIRSFAGIIVDEMSEDAAHWRGAKYIDTSESKPISIFFHFVEEVPLYGMDLLASIQKLISEPYRSNDFETAAFIIWAGGLSQADAIIELIPTEENLPVRRAGIAYIITFPTNDDAWLPGWLAEPSQFPTHSNEDDRGNGYH